MTWIKKKMNQMIKKKKKKKKNKNKMKKCNMMISALLNHFPPFSKIRNICRDVLSSRNLRAVFQRFLITRRGCLGGAF